jgi:hypothetical protein
MTSEDYFELLRENDTPIALALAPEGFDILKAKREVLKLQSALESQLGFKPLLDGQIQDATFFEELNIQPKINRNVYAVIRFSKFGRLVTILFPEKLSEEKFTLILNELAEHKYTYIPSLILESPYNGKVIGIETWRHRFSDWL